MMIQICLHLFYSVCTLLTGVLNALCCSSKDSPGYIDVLGQVGLRDPHSTPTIHSSLAVFTAIVIARHCFTLPDFLKCVALPSLMEAWNTGKKDCASWLLLENSSYLLLNL